jgi:hypothetical protein
MSSYHLAERRVPLDDSWDVICVGGGPAGCAAATAAAREGARTLLIEATGVLGGMGTAGLVPWFCGYGDGEKVIARGLANRVREELADGMPHLKAAMEQNPLTSPAIDPELLKRIYDEMVTSAGADIRFNARLCDVQTDESGAVEALIVADKSGLCAFAADVYADCTGDGDLAAWAGAPFEKGNESGEMQPASHCFVITNVDEDLLARGPDVHFYDPDSPVWRAIEDEKYPLIAELHSCNRKIGPGALGFNTGHVFGVDNTIPESTSEALIQGRRLAAQYRDAFAEYHPAFEDSFLATSGGLLGVRETRRITGEYVLSIDDYLDARSFPDEICCNAYGIDVHCSKDRCLELAQKSIEELKEHNRQVTRHLDPGESVGVPYRCLIPRGLTNVLVAGRCISTDRPTNGSIRIMACCLNTGEAAGVAAAFSAADRRDVREVDTHRLRRTLQRHGAYLPQQKREGP